MFVKHTVLSCENILEVTCGRCTFKWFSYNIVSIGNERIGYPQSLAVVKVKLICHQTGHYIIDFLSLHVL